MNNVGPLAPHPLGTHLYEYTFCGNSRFAAEQAFILENE